MSGLSKEIEFGLWLGFFTFYIATDSPAFWKYKKLPENRNRFFAYALDRLAGNPVKLIKLMLMKFRDPH